LRSEHLDDWVLISVEDTGTGINPERAERMFDPFFTTKPNGIGLGLSICRSIVEEHGARLSVFPVHPYGSIFQIMLPAATSTQQARIEVGALSTGHDPHLTTHSGKKPL
jgi:signal transduction histidine kinase